MDIKDIEHLAELSKLKFTEEELKEFSQEFEHLVEFADIVKNSQTTGTRNINCIDFNELREDKAQPSMPVDILLQNSPIVNKDSIVVPRIME